MRRLTAEGVAPAEAARWARQAPDPCHRPPAPSRPPAPAARRTAAARDPGRPRRPGGPRAGPRRHAAGRGGDARRSSHAPSPSTAWSSHLGRPCCARCSPASASGTRPPPRLIEVEHLFSRCVSEVLGAVPRPPRRPGPRGSCSPAPTRSSTACRWRRWPPPSRRTGLTSGCSAPGCRSAALADAVEPHRSGRRRGLVALRPPPTPTSSARCSQRPRRPMLVLAGGPGWRADELPAGVALPTSLTEAVSPGVGCLRWRPSASVEAVRPAPAPRSTPMRSRITVAAALAVLTVLVGVRWAMTRDVPATVPVVVAAPSAAPPAGAVGGTNGFGRSASGAKPSPPAPTPSPRSPTSRAARSARSARAG